MEIISSKGRTLSCVWMDFLNADDSIPFIMTDTKIKEIISSFESATNLVKIDVTADKEVVNFKKYIKTIVKDHKSSPERLMEDSSYDNFLSYIGKWKTTTADLIISAYAKYTNALNNFVIPKEFRLSREGVYALIKHRNDVTHGRISEITKQKLYTALQVMALTYCCILDAAKFPQETMEKIMQKGILKPN